MAKQLSFEVIMASKKLSKKENEERLRELASVLLDAYEYLREDCSKIVKTSAEDQLKLQFSEVSHV